MAAETPDIAESSQPDILSYDDWVTDEAAMLAEILRILRKWDGYFDGLLPLLDKYVSNPAAKWRRRAVPQDRQG